MWMKIYLGWFESFIWMKSLKIFFQFHSMNFIHVFSHRASIVSQQLITNLASHLHLEGARIRITGQVHFFAHLVSRADMLDEMTWVVDEDLADGTLVQAFAPAPGFESFVTRDWRFWCHDVTRDWRFWFDDVTRDWLLLFFLCNLLWGVIWLMIW